VALVPSPADAIVDDLWDWAEGVRRCVVAADPGVGPGPSLLDDVTRRVVAAIVGPVAERAARCAGEGDRTVPAAVRDLFGLP
jgi:hypothetical protein